MDALKDLCGGVEPVAHRIGGPMEIPPIYTFVATDLPSQGEVSGFTFGLSSVRHPNWQTTRPELSINVRSQNMAWVLATGELVRRHRGRAAFSIGDVFRFGSRICDESAMSAFFVFFSTILDSEDGRIVLTDRTINIMQVYPIYDEEIRILNEIGADKFFFRDDIDFRDVARRNQGAIS